MDSTRQSKVSKQLQKDLGEIFQQKGNVFVAGKLITVTTVRISPDMGLAKVYLSVFPSEGSKEVIETVKEKGSTIRYELGKRIKNQLRIVPELHFYIDDSLDYIDNLDNLLNK